MRERRPGSEAARRKLHGRRRGKRLRAAQERLLEELLPHLRVPGAAPRDDPGRHAIDLDALFPGSDAVWLEIGFGGGEHLLHQAMRHPEIGLIGCEPYVGGIAMTLRKIADAGAANVRIHPDDARDLIELLPPASLGRVFLLYPDPWPKARHAPRRFMNPDNLALLRPVMRPGAELRLATDIPDYVAHALNAVAAAPGFAQAPGPAADWSRPWADWPGTRYEAKAVRAGRRPHYLTFMRA